MPALNAILLVGALSLLPRGLREAVSVKITEKTTVIKKKTERKGLLDHLEKRLYCELEV